MIHAGAEHRVIRLAGTLLEFRERTPGAVQQILAPAFEELLFELGEPAVRGRWFLEAGIQRQVRPLAPVMVVDQVLDSALHVVTESSPLRVAMAKIAAEKSEGEFLVQLRGRLGVFQGFEQVTVDGPRIPANELRDRCANLFRRTRMGLKNDGPLSGHLANSRIGLDVFQSHSSRAERLPRVDNGDNEQVRGDSD